MEIDVAALQRLPETAEVVGLRPDDPLRCLPGKKTKVWCVLGTCRRTQVIISASPR